MCGFVGFVGKQSKEKKRKIIKDMSDMIVHRGPDSDGYYIDDNVALGFRRLSIIVANLYIMKIKVWLFFLMEKYITIKN